MDSPDNVEDLRHRLAAAERALAETAAEAAHLRDRLARCEPIFQSMDEGYLLADVIFDHAGRAVDIAYVDSNPAAIRMTGVDLKGKRLREVSPDHEDYWYEIWGRVAVTGIGERLQRHAVPNDIWYDFFVFKPEPDARESRRVAVLFQDVTERQQAEMRLRESEARQAFLLKLSDGLRPLFDAVAIQVEASRILRTQLGADRVAYAEVDQDEDTARLLAEDKAEHLISFVGATYAWSGFDPVGHAGAKQGRSISRADVQTDDDLGPEQKAAFAAVQCRAYVNVPLRKSGRLVAFVAVHFERPHAATSADIDLVEETAERTWAAVEWSRAERALRGSEVRFRALVTAGGNTIYRMSPDWRLMYQLNSDTLAATAEPISNWVEKYILAEDLPRVRAAIDSAIDTKSLFELEHRVLLADGSAGWVLSRAVPLLGPDGSIVEWFAAGSDVTERCEMQERQGVLVAELQHRTRNLMGVVRSMADKTMRRSTDLADFQERYSDRLAALARVQGLLSRLDGGQRITFDELIHAEMAALNGSADRATLNGPTGVALRSSTVQTFALALHELATNAMKYGAFAQPGGRLEIRWRLERAETDVRSWLHVDWRERGVVMPAAPAAQGSGSGRELIERALPYQLGARTTYVMEADGIHCTIALPVSERQEARETADA